jgi:hypothetical protein
VNVPRLRRTDGKQLPLVRQYHGQRRQSLLTPDGSLIMIRILGISGSHRHGSFNSARLGAA